MPTSARMVAVAAHGLAGSRTDLPHEPLSEVEWFDLVQGCITADLVGLLAAAAGDGHLPVTAGQAEELDVLAAEHAGLSALVERHAVTIASLLEIAGIDHRIVDGPALALAYPGDATHKLRPARRVRVLVGPERFDDARALQGARPAISAGPVPRHERLAVVDVLPGLGRAPRADLPALLGGPARLDLDGRSVPVLALEQQLVVACAELSLMPVPSLIALRDVAQLSLAPALDVRAARRLADRVGSSDALGGGVAQAWTWFDLADKTGLSVWALRRSAPRADRTAGRASSPAARVSFAQRVLGRRAPAPAAVTPTAGHAAAPSVPGPPWSPGDSAPVPSAAEGYARPHRSTGIP
jgi:hypothetical protein